MRRLSNTLRRLKNILSKNTKHYIQKRNKSVYKLKIMIKNNKQIDKMYKKFENCIYLKIVNNQGR